MKIPPIQKVSDVKPKPWHLEETHIFVPLSELENFKKQEKEN